MMKRDLLSVAQAALAWNRARLRRIAIRSALPKDVFSHDYLRGFQALDRSRKDEAKAKAVLRKACAAADPSCTVIEAQMIDSLPEPSPRSPALEC